MTVPYDQDAEDRAVEMAENRFGATEIVPAAGPSKLPAALGDYKPVTEAEAEFLALLVELPWIEDGDAGIRMALDTALGDPEKAGEAREGRSPRNLKLKNRAHTVVSFALARSSLFTDSTGRQCPVYAQVEATWPSGEVLSYSIGGWGPIGQLVAWHHGGLFPHPTMIVEIPTGKGNPAYRYQDA